MLSTCGKFGERMPTRNGVGACSTSSSETGSAATTVCGHANG